MNPHSMYNEAEAIDPHGLVAGNAYLVKRIAFHLAKKLPPSVQVEDLIQSGMIGLVEAAERYDPSRGASFETYAGIRIRGAMIDEIRVSDWSPRSVHKNARDADQALSELEQITGREPTCLEVAQRLGVCLNEYHTILREGSSTHVFSIDQPDDETGKLIELPKSDEPTPSQSHEAQAVKKAISLSIDNLPKRQNIVMTLYYDSGLTLREIGEILKISESRVCQIHAIAISKLKNRLVEWAA